MSPLSVKISNPGVSFIINTFHDTLRRCQKKLQIVFLFLCTNGMILGQDLNHMYMIPTGSDTLDYMIDHLPLHISSIPWNTTVESWDLNTLKAPFIRRSVLISSIENKDEKKVEFEHNQFEHFYQYKDSILTHSLSGIPFFLGKQTFNGTYMPFRKHVHPSKMPDFQKIKYRILFPCTKNDLPASVQNQLPYEPDSIRIVIEVQEENKKGGEAFVSLHLQQLKTNYIFKKVIQSILLETKKSNLDWQNINRLIKTPKIFKTDTCKSTWFYKDADLTPLACVYYSSNDQIEKVIYKAPLTYKDLPIATDFKPSIYFFPNPYSTGLLRCELLINKPGLYTFRIINLVGTELKRENLYLERTKTFDKDLSFLPKGTYFISLEQDKNHIVSTKRLYVIKPE